jgi:hypothetical protein
MKRRLVRLSWSLAVLAGLAAGLAAGLRIN